MQKSSQPISQEKVVVDDETLQQLAKLLDVDASTLDKSKIVVTQAVLDKLKSGEATLVRKEISMEEYMASNPEALSADYQKKLAAASDQLVSKGLPKANPEGTPTSQYTCYSKRFSRTVLAERPPDAPSILEECIFPIKLVLHQHQCPGDIAAMTAAVRDLHTTYPGYFITEMRTTCMELWQANHYHRVVGDGPDVMHIEMNYPLINFCDDGAYHMIHGFRKYLESVLGLPIKQGPFKGYIPLTALEKSWNSQVFEEIGKDVPYWLINAGSKSDYTCKQWNTEYYQQVVDSLPEITFVQIGEKRTSVEDDSTAHLHPKLTGDNVIDFVGKTDLRQFVRLLYHAAGVITPVSMAMHLSAAIEPKFCYGKLQRPCIVIAGGREPEHWEAYPGHQFLHTEGMLPCALQGGCWKSRVVPLLDGNPADRDSLCKLPVKTGHGQYVPECMLMITPDDVVRKVQDYLRHYDYSHDNIREWGPLPTRELDSEVHELYKKAKTKPTIPPGSLQAKRKQEYIDALDKVGTIFTAKDYQKVHDTSNLYKKNNWLVDELAFLKEWSTGSIIEAGCGNGRFLKAASSVFDTVTGCDWARSPILEDILRKNTDITFIQQDLIKETPDFCGFDIAASADFLEHIPPEFIQDVITKIDRWGDSIFHKIACYGGTYHLTVRTPQEWLAMFQEVDKSYTLLRVDKRRGHDIAIVTRRKK